MSNLDIVYLPSEYHQDLDELWEGAAPEYSLGPPRADQQEIPGLTVFEGDGPARRVRGYGAEFFQRLAVWENVVDLELPLGDPYTADAVELVRALGYSFHALRAEDGGWLALSRRALEAGAADSVRERWRGSDRERSERIKAEYESALEATARRAAPVLDGADGPLEEVRRSWMERAASCSHADVFLWSQRYWLYRILGSTCPIFLSRSQVKEWKAASERVLEGLHQAVLRLAESEELRLHILGSAEPIPSERPMLARFDGALQPEGPMFFELNVGAIGFSDTDRAVGIFDSLGLSRDLPAAPYPIFSNAVATFEKMVKGWQRRGPRPVLAIPVAAAEEPKYAPGLLAYVKLVQAAGWEAHFCPLASLRYEEGRLLTEEGQAVDIVARAYFPGSAGTEHVEEALRDGAALLINPPASHGNKGVFELLDDPAIPWTRLMREGSTQSPEGDTVDLLEYALAHQETLVLKPSDGFGGAGVLLGNKTEPEAWEKALRETIEVYPQGRRSILQKICRMPTQTFVDRHGHTGELFWDLNAFVFDGEFGGLAARLSPSTVTNISLGGGAVPIYVV